MRKCELSINKDETFQHQTYFYKKYCFIKMGANIYKLLNIFTRFSFSRSLFLLKICFYPKARIKALKTLKGTVSVISSDTPCKDTMPDLQRYPWNLSDLQCERCCHLKIVYSDKSYMFSCSRNAQFTLRERKHNWWKWLIYKTININI